MPVSPQSHYLTTEVMTASPQKLQLTLIDAAIRSAERARARWHAGDDAQAAEALGRAEEIVGTILAGLNREHAPAMIPKVAGVYLFLFRTLMAANLNRDERKLDEALRVLRVERETWRQLCERLGNHSGPGPASSGLATGPFCSEAPAPLPHPTATTSLPEGRAAPDGPDMSEIAGLSLEA